MALGNYTLYEFLISLPIINLVFFVFLDYLSLNYFNIMKSQYASDLTGITDVMNCSKKLVVLPFEFVIKLIFQKMYLI